MSDPSRALLAELLTAAQNRALVEHYANLANATGIAVNASLLPLLLKACANNHEMELEEYQARQAPPERPVRGRPKTGHPYLDWMLARDEDDFELYAEDWDAIFKRTHSNDGHNRTNRVDGPPVTPLYRLHLLLTLFYHHDLLKPFTPELVRNEKKQRSETPRDYLITVLASSNDAFRLFYFTARHIDPAYRLENCNAVLEGLKKQKLSPAAKQKRRAFMRKYMAKRRAAARQ